MLVFSCQNMQRHLKDLKSVFKFTAQRINLCEPLDKSGPLQVTLGTNYFGPFFLTHLLMDRLRTSAPARIVWVVSSLEVIGDITWDDLK